MELKHRLYCATATIYNPEKILVGAIDDTSEGYVLVPITINDQIIEYNNKTVDPIMLQLQKELLEQENKEEMYKKEIKLIEWLESKKYTVQILTKNIEEL